MKMFASVAMTATLLSTPALAQNDAGGRGSRPERPAAPSAEQMASTWTWQAKGLAHDMKLDANATKQLVEAYVTSRTELSAKLAASRPGRGEGAGGEGEGRGGSGGRGDRGGRGGMNPEIIDAARSSLSSALKPILDGKQLDAAMNSIGRFNRQFDMMSMALIDMKLDEAKTLAAMTPMRDFVVGMDELREAGDREGMREGMMELRENLEAGLSKALSTEQAETLLASMRRGGGRGGDMRPGQGRGGDARPGEGRGGGRGGEGRGGDSVASTVDSIGKPAPAFTLKDSDDKAHSLADFKGRIVVLQWINPDCPVCRAVASSGRVAAMEKEVKKLSRDIVFLTVNSTHYMEPAIGAEYLKSHDLTMPLLIDRDGKVGKLYAARTTPHLFVIDAEGVLRYSGAIDDDQTGRKGAEATNYVVNAVRQIVNGETVTPDATKPYGCSVKYAP
jgi:peroxiredoxin